MKSLFVGLLLAALPLHAGIFSSDFDSRKGGVVIRVVRPAERYLNGKTMRLRIGTTPKPFKRDTELLAAIERALSTQFVRAESGDADLLFEVDVAAYEAPTVREYEVNEKRRIQVGEQPLYNKDGTPKKNLFGGQATQPIYEERLVPIGYWEGKGRLSIRLSVSPRGSSAAIDSATATAEFSEKKKISDPAPESSLADLGRMIGIGKKAPEESRQTADGLDLQFIEQVSNKTCSRFARTVNQIPLVLATEASLAGGTALALAGDWSAAIETWDKTTVKNAKNEWMRQFNLGVGNVALAFSAYDQGQDVSQAAALFDRGGQLLLKASAAKPGEKHIKDALQLYGSFKSAMQNIASETAAREENEKRALAEIAAQREKQFRDNRPDSSKEAAFRQLVTIRLRGAKGALPAQERTDLEATGQKGYGLTALQAQRVVFQENDRIESAAAAVGTYEETFSALVEDGVLSTEERGVLQDLARNLAIPKSSLDSIHKRYTFKEQAPPKSQEAKPKGAKSSGAASPR
jgi:hypothetical protein